MQLTEIWTYPVKSLAGFQRQNAEVSPIGLIGDRTMMLVDKAGVFITQRKYPQLARIQLEQSHPELSGLQLTVSSRDQSPLVIRPDDFTDSASPLEVWGDRCHGFAASLEINQWFSDYLEMPVKLVSYDHSQPRAVDPDYAQTGDAVSFADGFPLLVISQASLDDLNDRLQSPVSMRSFRPNLVIEGCEPYAEDNWRKIQIGDVIFDAVKCCSRCILTTVDPDTGEVDPGREPLRTLSQYRRQAGGVMFGMNLIPRSKGKIELNAPATILE